MIRYALRSVISFRSSHLSGNVPWLPLIPSMIGVVSVGLLSCLSLTIARAEQVHHALIVGIANYSPDSETPPLPGVNKDVLNAHRMAKTMGVDAGNVVELRDEQATKGRILAELERLQGRVRPGDRVLIYYSGHGTRYAAKQGCVEGLQTYTTGRHTVADIITEEDLARYTRPISERADKVIAMIDSCFSGGVLQSATRSLTGDRGPLRSRFNPQPGPQCNVAVNTRNLLSNLERMGVHSENFVQIAAAGRNEVSWENNTHGGLATHTMTQCLLGDASDLNRSGAVSLDEVRACAQDKLNVMMKPLESRGMLPSTIQVRGNRNLIVVQKPPAAPVVLAQAPSRPDPVPPPRPEVVNPPQLPQVSIPTPPATITEANPIKAEVTQPVRPPPPATTISIETRPPPAANPGVAVTAPAQSNEISGPRATLQDIYAQRNPRIKIDVTVPKSMVIGTDHLDFVVRSETSGYLYILLLGSDEKSFYLLFPNKVESDNRVQSGKTYTLPGPGWRIKAGGPAGQNRLLFVVSKSPRDPALFVSDSNSGGGVFTYSVTDEASRVRLIDFFVGRGAKDRNRELGAVLASIEERP